MGSDWLMGGRVRSGNFQRLLDFQRLFSRNLTKWSSLDSSETFFFPLKLPSFLSNITKLRPVCLQNRSVLTNFGLMMIYN